ncbi:MAG: hypothetical protein EOP83_04435 [Verrucomicrobiaceae bacterium]|nr:MAG: hypothetical protein EOP83_04435 [Verrucomicrobiaceae bacterium]
MYTSDNACHQHVRRLIEEHGRDYVSPMQHLTKMVRPLIQQYASRKKARRGEVFPAMRSLYEGLGRSPSVIHADFHTHMQSRLSANESFEIGFLQTARPERRLALEVMYGRVKTSRTAMSMNTGTTRFVVCEHVLNRYMRRERKPPSAFFADLQPALHMAYTLGLGVLTHQRNELVLPHGDGLLLGYAYWSEAKKGEEITEVVFSVDNHELKPAECVKRQGPISKCVPHFEINTYLSSDDLLAAKEALRDILNDYYVRYEQSLKHTFEDILLQRGGISSADKLMECIREGHKLLKTPQWNRYLELRERNEFTDYAASPAA